MTSRPIQTPMPQQPSVEWIAFSGTRRVASGDPRDVASKVKALVDADPQASVLIFDARSSHMVELDLRGSADAVLRRLPRAPQHETAASIASTAGAPRGPGRPKLGVVAREVTLLPRHWDWLASQPGGASVALRKLVEQARRASKETDRLREARDAAYRFMVAVAGDAPGFEEASRALFANDTEKLRAQVARWPREVRSHLLSLVERATAQTPSEEVSGS
jgi:hypothetical protein